jgi:hypothetical protein
MIITKFRLQEEHPMAGTITMWPLPICDLNVDSSAGLNGYLLKAVTGIGPPNFISVVDGFDTIGIPIMDSIPDNREIALRIGFSPKLGQSINELRSDLYKYISRSVILSLMNDAQVVAQTKGFISKFETVHFSNQPEIQITISCKTGEFEAPASLPIPLDTLDTLTPVIGYNEGDAPAGLDLKFKYTAIAAGTGFVISKYGKLWYAGDVPVINEFRLTYPFATNDEITISTHPGKKRITLLRGATTYDLAGYINGGAVWPKLYPGVNTFEWTFASSWMQWLSASYTPRYWGV